MRRPQQLAGAEGFFLVVVVEGQVTRHQLPNVGRFAVGRSSEADIPIDDKTVSRRHAMIELGETLSIMDHGSANGTKVRNRRLVAGRPIPVTPGEAFEIGDTLLIIQKGSVAAQVDQSEEQDQNQPVVVDPEMMRLHEMARRVAVGSISVLLLGETGTGKEIFAEVIHQASLRRKGPLLKINCAALSETLLESELFGHERGAFTGAVRTKRGLLEEARGGTVFLDELGELPLTIQAKLLRVIEQRQVTPVGALRAKAIDVRFVAATNKNLESEIARGAFRRDLYFRLNGVVLSIPPLRQRPEEVERLAERFAAHFAHQLGRSGPPRITADARQWLLLHTWPGNIRELRNTIERATLLASNNVIARRHLPDPELQTSVVHSSMLAPKGSHESGEFPICERRVRGGPPDKSRVLAALAATGWNQSEAAKVLGISRRTILNWLDALEIQRPRKRAP